MTGLFGKRKRNIDFPWLLVKHTQEKQPGTTVNGDIIDKETHNVHTKQVTQMDNINPHGQTD